MVYLPLKLSVFEDGLPAETFLTVKILLMNFHYNDKKKVCLHVSFSWIL